MSEHESSNAVPVGEAEQFITAVFDELEERFRNQFGPRWSVQVNDLYQKSQAACYASARRVDQGMASPTQPSRHVRILTNYPGGRSGVERGA